MVARARVLAGLLLLFVIVVRLQPSYARRFLGGEDSIEELEAEYDRWISWHLQKTREQLLVNMMNKTDGNNTSRGLEKKARKAEENKRLITVSAGGDGDFRTIIDAVESIEVNNTRRTILYIKAGVYREKVVIPKWKPFVTFMGDANGQPIITGNDTASVVGVDGLPLRTFHSATVAVNSNYFMALNIRFENTAPYPEGGRSGGQAVALRISGNKAAFYNCSFYGAQDTLYDHKGLHYFKDCFIQGSEDFIFGYGRSLYENCQINSIAQGVGALTAQKRNNSSLSSGFSFVKCTISGSGLVYLGRAWGDHSRVVFAYTFMDDIVMPQGWDDWGLPERERTVYYGQYKCSGPGADTTGRVQWERILNDEEARPFLGTDFIEGQKWIVAYPNLPRF